MHIVYFAEAGININNRVKNTRGKMRVFCFINEADRNAFIEHLNANDTIEYKITDSMLESMPVHDNLDEAIKRWNTLK